jgi:hypothetical protein
MTGRWLGFAVLTGSAALGGGQIRGRYVFSFRVPFDALLPLAPARRRGVRPGACKRVVEALVRCPRRCFLVPPVTATCAGGTRDAPSAARRSRRRSRKAEPCRVEPWPCAEARSRWRLPPARPQGLRRPLAVRVHPRRATSTRGNRMSMRSASIRVVTRARTPPPWAFRCRTVQTSSAQAAASWQSASTATTASASVRLPRLAVLSKRSTGAIRVVLRLRPRPARSTTPRRATRTTIVH